MGLFRTLSKIGGAAASFIPGVGPIVGPAIASLPGLIGGGRGGAPKPGFAPTRTGYTFGNDPTQIDTSSGFQVPEGLSREIALPGEDPATRARRTQISSGLADFGGDMQGVSRNFLNRASGDLGASSDFYRSLLAGDAAARAEALAPEINTANQATQAALDSIEQFGPRGGGRARAAQQARIGRAGTIAGIMSKARPMAAEGLGKLAAIGSQAGVGAGGLGVRAGGTAGELDLQGSRLDFDRARTESQQNLDRQLGTGRLALGGAQADTQRELGINRLLLQGDDMINRTQLGQARLGQAEQEAQSKSAASLGEGIADWMAGGGFGFGRNKTESTPGTKGSFRMASPGVVQKAGPGGFSFNANRLATPNTAVNGITGPFKPGLTGVGDQYNTGRRAAGKAKMF